MAGRRASAILASRMAAALGVDVQRAIASGDLSIEGWRGALAACSGCGQPLTCEDWMDARDAGRPVHRPAFCANAPLIETLQIRRV